VRCEMLSALVAEEAATDLPHKANGRRPSRSGRASARSSLTFTRRTPCS
jgi:hypothetical protein